MEDFHIYLRRALLKRLKKSLTIYPVVFISGARQTGKTTLVKELAKLKKYTYVTFDDLRFLAAARGDPQGFLSGLPKPLILDEVQRVPEIFLAIKQDVDENRKPGRYLLTGSANPLLVPKVGDSLAGRMEIMQLHPLSQGELLKREECFIDRIFEETFSAQSTPEIPKEVLSEMMVTGGYPVMRTFKDEEALDSWCNSYITSMLQKDVQELSRIEGLRQLPTLLHLLSSRAGNLLNVQELARTSGIAATTLQRYVQLLQALYLVDFVSPWTLNYGKRFVKSPKIYLSDTGILCFLLGANQKKLLLTPHLMGNVLENFAVSELQKQMTWNQRRVKLYFMRTTKGIEVDIVLEDAEGNLVAIEIKSSQKMDHQDFKGINFLKETTKERFKRGIVLYPGKEAIPFGKDLWALPLSSIWI